MRLTLVISSLGAGGAERVMTHLANYWARLGWAVTLLTLDDGGEPPFYALEPAVRHRALGLLGASHSRLVAARNNLFRIRRLRQGILATSPDAVISFMTETNVLTLLALLFSPVPVIVSERSNPWLAQIGAVWSTLRGFTYPRAACLVVPTQRSVVYFTGEVQRKAVVIPNPVAHTPAPRAEGARTGRKTILGMGRLLPVKGFDLLIAAFGRIAARHPEWDLRICGEGPERTALEAAAEREGLRGRVSLPGVVTDAFAEMARADIFVLSSRFEGFPNALIEAMSCGLPAIAFDCQTGPKEIIRDGKDGLLVEAGNVDGLAAAMESMIENPERRAALGKEARAVAERFSVERVMALWEGTIRGVARAPGSGQQAEERNIQTCP